MLAKSQELHTTIVAPTSRPFCGYWWDRAIVQAFVKILSVRFCVVRVRETSRDGKSKVVFTLELVWPTSQVEPGSMGWCEQKNNQKNPTRVENFNPGNRRVQPGFDTGLTRIEHSVNRNRWLWPGLIPEVGCFVSPALSLATSYNFWHGVADVFNDFLRSTTVAYYRHWHPPWWSKVTCHWHETINFRVQYANLSMWIEARQILLH